LFDGDRVTTTAKLLAVAELLREATGKITINQPKIGVFAHISRELAAFFN
jgi:hypothetical protein